MAAAKITELLRRRLMGEGACLVGCADISALPPQPRQGLPRGISIAAALEPGIVSRMGRGPDAEYRREYDRLNALLTRLADSAAGILCEAGFRAVPKVPTHSEIDWAALSTPLPHKTVATLSGLGWIGKNALLVTREYGNSVRLASVLTDAPLETGAPVERSFCGTCAECGRACPGGAVSGKTWERGKERAEFFDAHACHRVTRGFEAEVGDLICGICIAACPWTRKRLKREGAL